MGKRDKVQSVEHRGYRIRRQPARHGPDRVTIENGVGQRIGTGRIVDGGFVYDQTRHPSAPHGRLVEVALGLREPKKKEEPPKAAAVSTHRPDPAPSFAPAPPRLDSDD